MDDGWPFMWTCFMMENDMTMIITLSLVEGSSSFMIIAPQLVQLLIVKQCHQKKSNKWWKKVLEGDGMMFC
jgi:hypothetical protein